MCCNLLTGAFLLNKEGKSPLYGLNFRKAGGAHDCIRCGEERQILETTLSHVDGTICTAEGLRLDDSCLPFIDRFPVARKQRSEPLL